MTGNVTHLSVVQAGEDFRLPADKVLTEATGQGLETVVVCGRAPDGVLYIASNRSDAESLLLIEKARMTVVLASMEDEE